MMRRIVDSVSFMIDSEETKPVNVYSPVDSKEESVPNGVVSTPSTDSINESLGSECSLVEVLHQDVAFDVPVNGCLLTDSTSYFVAPKPDLCVEEHGFVESKSPTPSPVRRRQISRSPSPIDLTSVSNRNLPGGQTRRQPQKSVIAPTPSKKDFSKKTPKKPKRSNVLTNAATNHVESNEVIDEDVGNGGIASQAEPLALELDCLLLPFVRNLRQMELRIPTDRWTNAHRRLLKLLAAEYGLIVMPVTKDQFDLPTITVRKKASLFQKQQLELAERERAAAEERVRRAELERLERLQIEERELACQRVQSSHQEMCCQTNSGTSTKTGGKSRRRQKKKQKPKQLVDVCTGQGEVVKRKPKKVDCSMQTVPEDYWLCGWCLQHIAPSAQCGHEIICRAGVLQKKKELELKQRLEQRNAELEARRRQRLGLPQVSKKKTQDKSTPVSGHSRGPVSREHKAKTNAPRDKPSDAVVSGLEAVHPNDVEAMLKLMRRVCAQPNCKQLSISTRTQCPQCNRVYCSWHRPVGSHDLCTTRTEPSSTDHGVSMACGWDLEEKRAALKSALRERKAALQQRRLRE